MLWRNLLPSVVSIESVYLPLQEPKVIHVEFSKVFWLLKSVRIHNSRRRIHDINLMEFVLLCSVVLENAGSLAKGSLLTILRLQICVPENVKSLLS